MGKRKHIVNVMFTLLLLGVFALTAIFVAVLGAQVYRSSAEKMQANFDTRTSLVYISEKVRQSTGTNFEVRDIGGQSALVITEEYDNGRTYETWMYVYDGKLHETTVVAGSGMEPGTGQAIMDMKSMDFNVDGDLVKITSVNDAGDEESLTLSRRS
ncbi:MAG: DUF4860 domain-containing protein [Clostridiales Family XIII bacterium]|jgi:hypothetical protein|nr:DUF4860 domain-containing protein [Clostridiales Family XIII bacterium]